MDRTPLWVDLVPVFHLLFTPVVSSAFTDYARPLASSPPQQPLPLVISSVARWLPSRCLFDSATFPWDLGSSLISNLRRQQLRLNPSIVGVLFLCWLDWPAFYRRFARSFRLGVRVLDAPATLHRRLRHLRRHGQRHLRCVQIQSFIVNWSFSKDLSVNWLL
jgi:hypothetical protein